jgi:hypothetical protein
LPSKGGPNPGPRQVDLGIYIVNLQVQPPNLTYIRAVSNETHSVIYAEAATLALATVIIHRSGLHNVIFFLIHCIWLAYSTMRIH